MRRSLYALAAAAVLLALLVSGAGCGKKVTAPTPPVAKETPPPPPSPPAPAPTISLNASPSAIESGQSTTLSWNSSNATTVTIDNGVGTVEASEAEPSAPQYLQLSWPGPRAPAAAPLLKRESPSLLRRQATPPPPPAISDSEFFSHSIKDAFFDYDQYNIRDDARAALQADARALKERPGIRVTIEGHCDERGSEKFNLALGDRRANAAKDFLVSQGIDGSRIDTISYGKERNVCEQHNEECWQLNRRAHLVMR